MTPQLRPRPNEGEAGGRGRSHSGRGNRVPGDVIAQVLEQVRAGVSIRTAAALLGWNDRTIYRWANLSAGNRAELDRAIAAFKVARAEQLGRHQIGCRCGAADCRRRNSERTREWRKRKQAAGFVGLTHGGLSTYAAGCRCETCTAAHSSYCRQRRRAS